MNVSSDLYDHASEKKGACGEQIGEDKGWKRDHNGQTRPFGSPVYRWGDSVTDGGLWAENVYRSGGEAERSNREAEKTNSGAKGVQRDFNYE